MDSGASHVVFHDTFCFWHIRSFKDLRTAANQLLTVIDTFESMEMSINFTKSSLARSLKGTHVTKAHQCFIQWMDGATVFKLRRRTHSNASDSHHGRSRIPWSPSFVSEF